MEWERGGGKAPIGQESPPQHSFAFTRWLFNHPKVLVERAAIMECKEAVRWEDDARKRSKIGEQERRLTANIDDTLSTAIVTKRKDRRGQMVWPWA